MLFALDAMGGDHAPKEPCLGAIRACRENKDLSITQIAYAVGFTSQTHFSSAFKKVYGLSPMEYAQPNKNKDVHT